MQWLEAAAAQARLFRMFYLRAVIHWNNLEWYIKLVVINSFFA